MCLTLAPAKLSGTIIHIGEKIVNGELLHVLGYQNSVVSVTDSANAMVLHFPSRSVMTSNNVVNTVGCKNILKDMKSAIQPPELLTRGAKGFSYGVTRSVQIFDTGIYTVVLADDASLIPAALHMVPKDKRPQISNETFNFYTQMYPGWSIALCCFNNRQTVDADPMMWWYKPQDEDTFTLPGIDSHNGQAPLQGDVDRDHWLVYGSYRMPQNIGSKVFYTDNVRNVRDLANYLPERVVGFRVDGKGQNGDFTSSVHAIYGGHKDLNILPFSS